jgi:cytochrome c oxidase cbb3-type subunit 2
VTEMDAVVAYLQMLGTLVQFRDVTPEQLRQQ